MTDVAEIKHDEVWLMCYGGLRTIQQFDIPDEETMRDKGRGWTFFSGSDWSDGGPKGCVPHVCWAGERQLLTSAVPLLPHAASLSCSVSSLTRFPAPQTTWASAYSYTMTMWTQSLVRTPAQHNLPRPVLPRPPGIHTSSPPVAELQRWATIPGMSNSVSFTGFTKRDTRDIYTVTINRLH